MRYLICILVAVLVWRSPTRAESQAVSDAVAGEVVHQLNRISDMHWHRGEYAHLVNVNRMVIAAHPQQVDAYIDAGWILWSMDRDSEAEALYDQGIAANPNTYALYNEMGFYLLTRRKDPKRGLEMLEKAIEQPDCPKIVIHTLAHAYERVGQLRKSLDLWNRAADDPTNPGRAAARVNRNRVRRLVESGT